MSPLLISIIIYIALVIFLFSLKPKFCFDKYGNLKKFGIGKNKTPFTFMNISMIIGLFAFMVAQIHNKRVIEQLIEELA